MADRKRVQFRFWLSPLTIDQGLFMRSTNLETQLFTTVIKVTAIILWMLESHVAWASQSRIALDGV